MLTHLLLPLFLFQDASDATRAEAAISLARYRARMKFLADDVLEGRAPGSRGGDLAARFLATEFQRLGLTPGGADQDFLQPVPLVGMKSDPPTEAVVRKGEQTLPLEHHKELVLGTLTGTAQGQVDAEIVYVGFGIRAPEQQDWDDFKGVDVKGKELLCLVNDPPSEDPKFFGGPAMTYYGRWTYKYEEAERRGAAGCLLIHTDGSAGYPWSVVQSGWSGREQFRLARGKDEPAAMQVQGWIHKDAARRLLELAGQDIEALRETAKTKAFKPVPLGVHLRASVKAQVRTLTSPNVIAVLPGADPKLKDEVLVHTAHYDHLGIGTPLDGDAIYNGAFDNASGAATLAEIAAAYLALPSRPARTIVFINTTAEESGLLGSEWYARNPRFPLARTVAVLNLDGINIRGRTKDLRALGIERSSLQQTVTELGKELGFAIVGDQFPAQGLFYRSDHFPMARRGVPPVSLNGGLDYEGRPEGWGKEQEELYRKLKYHQPGDQFDESWDLSGAVQIMKFAFRLGLKLANDPGMPEWNAGDEFAAARKAGTEGGR